MMTKLLKVIVLMSLCLMLAGCGAEEVAVISEDTEPEVSTLTEPASPEDCIANENMVFDYYEAVVATVGGNESTEYVLYKYTDTQMVLARYTKEEDSEEKMDYRLVPSSVLDDCMAKVKKYKMSKWKDGRGLNGMRYVVKFMDKGEMLRVSSDDMPEDGREAFYAIRGVLVSEWAAGSRD